MGKKRYPTHCMKCAVELTDANKAHGVGRDGQPFTRGVCLHCLSKQQMALGGYQRMRRWVAFGRAAEPILREIQAQQQTRMVEPGYAAAIRAALALLDGAQS